MASILDRYGIKEVADVTFYDIDNEGKRSVPVLYLDTLKVSTIEQTAETSDARGGKGNPKLITWDYGKDITVTLEDALFSAKSLSIMFGNGTVDAKDAATITKTVVARLGEGKKIGEITVDIYDSEAKKAVKKSIPYASLAQYKIENVNVYSDASELVPCTTDGVCSTLNKGDRVFITYDIPVAKKEIVVSADSFPGTYYITGDTYARSDITGDDQFFQFIIPKAKVTSENTITLEAEGDPSVFNMNLTVLRPEDGVMMRLIQYDLAENRAINISGNTEFNAGTSTTLVSDVKAEAASAVDWASDDEKIDVTPTLENGYCAATITCEAGIEATATITAKLLSNPEITGSHIIKSVKA